MEFNGKEAALVFKVKAVESIPCEVRGSVLAFDSDGNMISDPIDTPWPMDWITEEVVKRVDGTEKMPDESRFRIYNPEEPDQYIFVEVQKF